METNNFLSVFVSLEPRIHLHKIMLQLSNIHKRQPISPQKDNGANLLPFYFLQHMVLYKHTGFVRITGLTVLVTVQGAHSVLYSVHTV